MIVRFVCLVTLVAVAEAAAQTSPRTLQVDLQSITINRVPKPPAGDYWDGSIVGNLFLGSVTGIYPDIEICLRRGAASQCRRVCVNAQLYEPEEAADPNIKPTVCKIEVDGRLPIARITEVPGAQPAREHFNLDVIVNEFDSTLNNEPRRHMGAFALKPADQPPLLTAPENCTPSQPCKISIPTKNGTFVASFATTVSGVLGTLPRTSTSTSTGGGVPPPPPRPTAPTVDEALRDLRDADNCRGPDQFVSVPVGTTLWKSLSRFLWGPSEADDYYALASLVAAIRDPDTRARVDARVRRKVEAQGNENLYAVVVRDVEASRSMDAAIREVGESLAGRLIRMGLNRLIPTISGAEVERWILKKLASDKLADEAIDLMFGDRNLTAECVLNELAKRGLQEEIGR